MDINPAEWIRCPVCGSKTRDKIRKDGELAAALLSLPKKKREIIYLYFFGNYTQQEIGDLYGHCKSTACGGITGYELGYRLYGRGVI